jgi:hypothetical protein
MAKYKANYERIIQIVVAAVITMIIFDLLGIFRGGVHG